MIRCTGCLEQVEETMIKVWHRDKKTGETAGLRNQRVWKHPPDLLVTTTEDGVIRKVEGRTNKFLLTLEGLPRCPRGVMPRQGTYCEYTIESYSIFSMNAPIKVSLPPLPGKASKSPRRKKQR